MIGGFLAGGTLTALLLASALHAQELKLGKYNVQMHGFGTQGFVHTDGNNWLTMNTNGVGSGAFTDAGLNLGTQINDRLRIGAQVYDRKLGGLGDWHPSLDWAMVDFRVKPWLGFRGCKVKTVLGLYNDQQDLDFFNTYALLPQSVYPIDLREVMIAHEGGDIYGSIRLRKKLGSVNYTAYGGRRDDHMYGGYPYLVSHFMAGGSGGIKLTSEGGPVYGGDLRWKAPLRGLLVGASRINEMITASGTMNMGGVVVPYTEWSKHEWQNQFYGQFAANRWHAESEYRRYLRDTMTMGGTMEVINDVRGWYVAGGYRVMSRLEAGAYYSHYFDNTPSMNAPGSPAAAAQAVYEYDKVVTGKFDVNRFISIKVEGHFIDGAGNGPYPCGFYGAQNPNGFQPNTNALVVRTSYSF
jgi:hypothetical protein